MLDKSAMLRPVLESTLCNPPEHLALLYMSLAGACAVVAGLLFVGGLLRRRAPRYRRPY